MDASSLPDVLQPLAWTCGTHHPVAVGPVEQQQQHPSHQQQQQQPPQEEQEEVQLLMAVAHKQRPHFGVQFHPESIATQYGVQLLVNFRDLAYAASGRPLPQALAHQQLNGRGPPGRAIAPWPWPVLAPQQQQAQQPAQPGARGLWPAAGVQQQLQLSWQRLDGLLEPAGGSQWLFEALVTPAPDTFWLDRCARGGEGGLWVAQQ